MFDQKDLLALECTSHGMRHVLQRSDVYWRMRYERCFHWRWVDNEYGFLLWLRNLEWRRHGRPSRSTVDIVRTRYNGCEAFRGLCWRLAYERRMEVESNIRNGRFEKRRFTMPHTECSGFGRHKEQSASGVFRQVAGYDDVTTAGFAFIRPYEATNGRVVLDDSVIPAGAPLKLDRHSLLSRGRSTYKSSTVLDTGHYTILVVRGAILARPTYMADNDNQWHHHHHHHHQTRYFLGNLETAEQIELKHGGPTPVFIEIADDKSALCTRAVIVRRDRTSGTTGSGLRQCHCKEMFGITSLMLIHSTETSAKQKACICACTRGISTHTTIRAIKLLLTLWRGFSSCPWHLWYYDRHLRDRTLVDIRSGKPIATPDDVQSIDAVYFNAAPTFLWVSTDFESAITMIDYTRPSVEHSSPQLV
ncbi:hypothetical protein BDF22DRAFT_777223 [Syncephalis plumigaleata]|nr:hypothetical protein BDF22DRAFT_777223 [Syncephalis plumigaleata]